MEWVEVRGVTLEAAKEEALDQLGVALDDAEFEVVQEPESRWLGIKKTEARVRARVKPTQARQKREGDSRRQRGRRGPRRQGGDSQQRDDGKSTRAQRGGGKGRGGQGGPGGNDRQRNQNRDSKESQSRGATKNSGQTNSNRKKSAGKAKRKEAAVREDSRRGELVPIDQQQEMVTEFLEGLVSSFGVDGSVAASLEDDIIIGSIEGDDLGLLIGPKGGTMRAIQELSRSALQRLAEGRDTSRLMIDVAGYRGRRRAALAGFAQEQAAVVVDNGQDLALEPMNSADRKAIHDAVVEIDGVKSVSEGDDPYRRVVLLPSDG